MVSKLKDTLLLVGDSTSDRAKLREIFESSFHLLEAENIPQAALLLEQNYVCVSAVLIDLKHATDEDVAMVKRAVHWGSDNEIPVLSLISPSGDGSREELEFARGASDVVIKPYTPASIRRRVQILTDLHLHKWNLQKLVADQQATIRNTNQVMVDALSAIIEHRNTESGNHVLRIRRFTKILLEDVARNWPEYGLTESAIDIIAGASALHDIGKISIPDAILNKAGKLTEEEFGVMKAHTVVGSQLIRNLSDMGDTEYLRYAYNIALYHHERWDGNGYPYGLAGEDIPICAQVTGIADAFDALTSHRVYKPALPYDQAINMILNNECGVFSPKLLECFKHVRARFVDLAHQYADGRSPKDDTIAVPLPGPTWKTNPLNTTQLSLVKYQTLLHHMNDTVLELDLDSGLYHVVYNPNPDLDDIVPDASFFNVVEFLGHVNIHPEDTSVVQEIHHVLRDEFFQQNLRRRSFRCRIFSPTQGRYRPYELTFLRVNTGNEEQRIVITVWHPLEETVPEHSAGSRNSLHAAPALHGLVSSALRCGTDPFLTIDAGAQDLYHLTGYTEEEIAQHFDNKLLNLVAPEDREAFSAAVQEHLERGGRAESEYRLLRKKGEPLWVLDKSRVYIEEDGREYVYRAIRDNSRGKSVEHQLKTSIERNQIVIDQSGGIVFEWDLASDTMYCSPKWKEHFGYTPVSKNYGSQMGIATHFHPDDLPAVRGAIEQIKNKHDTLSIDVRIADANAKYLWTKITATAYLDEQDRLVRIIGFLQDIDAMKRATLTLKEQAERDALTKLLNKVSTQRLISQYLAEREPGVLDAMLVLDLDNFKAINDNYGHLYGDAVLSQVGAAIKQQFRSQDIIGRIGGDEFLVLMRDIPDEELLHSRCRSLLTVFSALLEKNAPNLKVSCSIGAALIPTHGTGYADLFRRADEALYHSKTGGKNRYTVYDPVETIKPALGHVPTRIDSDEQPGMADASFVRFVFRCLYESKDIIHTINEILAYIGEQTNVSRVYIFENNDDNTTCSNTFEWCNEGVSPEIDSLQNISYITDIAGWQNIFDENGIFYCTDVSTLEPHFRAILEPQGIKSMLQCSILDNGVFRGYVGFDECSVHRFWTREQINLLQFFSEVLSLFLLKKRTQDRVEKQAVNLRSVLDRQDTWVYVIDPETYRLKFLNEKIKTLAPSGEVGQICYEVFMGRNSPCETCPAAKVHQETPAPTVIENPHLGLRVNSTATELFWNGKAACLISCYATAEEQPAK